MGLTPSYYDSIGLLAICDAIDAGDGIPFIPSCDPKPFTPSQLKAGIKKVPSLSGRAAAKATKNAPAQHILLSHIPVSGVFSPFGSLSYEEQHRMAINQLASTGQLPPQLPPHTIGGIRPNIPVAHNLHRTSGQRSRSTSIPQTPAAQSRRVSATQAQLHSNLSNNASGMIANKPSARPPMQSQLPMQTQSGPNGANGAGMSPQAGPASVNLPSAPYSRGESPSFSPPASNTALTGLGATPQPNLAGTPPLQAPMGIQGGSAQPQGLPSATNINGMLSVSASPMPTASVSESRASTPASPMESSQTQYRVEVCQICGRDFKGRKAATHKQQHIRRLHPAEYTPKRGGKKSRLEQQE